MVDAIICVVRAFIMNNRHKLAWDRSRVIPKGSHDFELYFHRILSKLRPNMSGKRINVEWKRFKLCRAFKFHFASLGSIMLATNGRNVSWRYVRHNIFAFVPILVDTFANFLPVVPGPVQPSLHRADTQAFLRPTKPHMVPHKPSVLPVLSVLVMIRIISSLCVCRINMLHFKKGLG
jgi:hypothetical protein